MSLKSKIDKVYKVRDPVHGFVKLDAQEMDIIDSPIYQRLRRIRQLSLTEMVYPGANHTRLEHSLGVVPLASEMFDNVTADEDNLKRLGIIRENAGYWGTADRVKQFEVRDNWTKLDELSTSETAIDTIPSSRVHITDFGKVLLEVCL